MQTTEDNQPHNEEGEEEWNLMEHVDKEQLFILPPIVKENPREVRERELAKRLAF